MLGLGLALALFVLAGVLLVCGVAALVFAPLLASRVAATTSRPKLERRASGDDRMRALINAQLAERKKRSGFSATLSRLSLILMGAAALSLIAALIAWFAGY